MLMYSVNDRRNKNNNAVEIKQWSGPFQRHNHSVKKRNSEAYTGHTVIVNKC